MAELLRRRTRNPLGSLRAGSNPTDYDVFFFFFIYFFFIDISRMLLSFTYDMTAIEQYFPVVLFIMLYKMVLTFEPVDKILKCDHSNESY